jgi:hypothetical protein
VYDRVKTDGTANQMPGNGAGSIEHPKTRRNLVISAKFGPNPTSSALVIPICSECEERNLLSQAALAALTCISLQTAM